MLAVVLLSPSLCVFLLLPPCSLTISLRLASFDRSSSFLAVVVSGLGGRVASWGWGWGLGGHEQKIDRIAEAFSQHYFSQRPLDGEGPSRGGFHSWDTVHILTFSIIMLNTDLHNPQVPRPTRSTPPPSPCSRIGCCPQS